MLSKKKLLQVVAVSINEYATELAKKGDDKLKAGDRVAGLELKDKAAEQMLRFVKDFRSTKSGDCIIQCGGDYRAGGAHGKR